MTLPQSRLSWCPIVESTKKLPCLATTVEDGPVPPVFRDNNNETKVPPSKPNGGIYGGPQSKNPWANIPVTPTSMNLTHHNLRSANPPPGATEQYQGNDRLGNNYVAMPGTYWFNPSDRQNMFRIVGPK
jgi:hypothetical protein